MSLTCGFYNSLNGDRKYDTASICKLFDGLIGDGVFATIGTALVVTATTGNIVNVGIGKAWFNHTYTYNDAILPLEAPDSELLLNRIDAVVLEVDSSESVRNNTIKFVTGTPSSNPVRPTLTKDGYVYQYPLCFINRPYGSTEIKQSDITNMVGTDECPFVTGIIQTVSLDQLLGQWRSELDQFVDKESADLDKWIVDQEAELTSWFNQMESDLTVKQEQVDVWIANEQADFLAWYESMKNQLSEDAAGNIQNSLDRETVNRILAAGFVDGSKVFSDDGTTITSTATDGRTLVKTFTNSFMTSTTILRSSAGADVAKMVKTFDTSGKTIDTVTTYY